MRKRTILFILCSLFLWTWTASLSAKEVTPEEAVAVATDVLRQHGAVAGRSVQSVRAVTYNGRKSYYIIQYAPEGWALVSADDMSSPLLGYSVKGTFRQEAAQENIGYWLEGYSRQIERNASLDGARHPGWEQASLPVTRAASDKIAPLIQVNWNQGKPYNVYCPSDSRGTAVVGCVAVAMAQAMSVARWPERPQGDYSYVDATYGTLHINYDNEAPYDWNAILTGANNKSEVARLLYHCGVSVNMGYGVDGSGTQTSYVPKALQRNFGYPASTKFYSRTSYSGDWKQLILNELSDGRAVCYSGADLKKGYGHCFNLDGYDGSFFHVNWGWGGANNGYFSLDALRDATMDMDYTAQQGVVVGIRPPSDKPSDIYLSATSVKEKQPAGTVVGTVTVESEAVNPTYNFSVRGEYSILLHDYVKAPFTVENGQLKTTDVLNKEDGDWTIEITATNTQNKASVTRQFTIHVAGASEVEESPANGVTLTYDRLRKELTLNATQQVSFLFFTDVEDVIGEGLLEPGASVMIPMGEVEAAYCILRLSNAGGQKDIRIIPRQE